MNIQVWKHELRSAGIDRIGSLDDPVICHLWNATVDCRCSDNVNAIIPNSKIISVVFKSHIFK